jgi:hypothetical protein
MEIESKRAEPIGPRAAAYIEGFVVAVAELAVR